MVLLKQKIQPVKRDYSGLDFTGLNRKLEDARKASGQICGRAGIRYVEVVYSFTSPIAQYKSRVCLNPFSMDLLNQREINAAVGHEIGHAVQPKVGLLKRIFVQRKLEYRADLFSATMTGDPLALVSVLQKKREIWVDVDENPHVHMLHRITGRLTHPASKKRIARLMEIKEKMEKEGTLKEIAAIG